MGWRLVLGGSVAATAFAGVALSFAPTHPTEAVPRLDPSADACARCHPTVAENWADSMHARAWTDPVFQAEYAAAPAASCRACHDPAGVAGREHGIDCATCHVQDGQVLSHRLSPVGLAAHPMRRESSLNDRCVGCHQFNFTDDGVHDPNEALQNTVEEWRSIEASDQTCVDCHLRPGVHVLRGLADREFVSSAVDVEIQPRITLDGLRVDVQVTGRKIGHAFPTGDVFRRAVLTVRTDRGVKNELVMQRWLARTADADGEASHVRTVDDTRVPPPGQGAYTESMLLDDPEATKVHWSLELHRLPLPRARDRGLPLDDVVIPVQRGDVSVTRP